LEFTVRNRYFHFAETQGSTKHGLGNTALRQTLGSLVESEHSNTSITYLPTFLSVVVIILGKSI
jgi:hypothetical protein